MTASCQHQHVDWNRQANRRIGPLWPCGNTAWDGTCRDCGQRVREEYLTPIHEGDAAVVRAYLLGVGE